MKETWIQNLLFLSEMVSNQPAEIKKTKRFGLLSNYKSLDYLIIFFSHQKFFFNVCSQLNNMYFLLSRRAFNNKSSNSREKNQNKKSCIRETPNLLTDADRSTVFFYSTGVKKGLMAFFFTPLQKKIPIQFI